MAATTNKMSKVVAQLISLMEGLQITTGTGTETIFANVYGYYIPPYDFNALSFKRSDGVLEAACCILSDDGSMEGAKIARHDSIKHNMYIMLYFRSTNHAARWERAWNTLALAIKRLNKHSSWQDQTITAVMTGYSQQRAIQGILGDETPLPGDITAIRLDMEFTFATGLL